MRTRRFLLIPLVFLIVVLPLCAKEKLRYKINIWGKGTPLAEVYVQMDVYIPENPNGTAVIICPGGSYHHLGISNEGKTSAKWFNAQGASAFILRYRHAQLGSHYPDMMQDVQRAIQIVRENAGKFKVDSDKVGLIGFSAGGHLVTWAGAFANRTNELEKLGMSPSVSLRPDFVIPVYPVVTMQEDIGHVWSRKSLLGTKNPPQEQRDLFSMELQIPPDMPPVYLVACKDDPVVIYENSERLYSALLEKGINCIFKSYEWGGHGFGMTNKAFMQAFHWNDDLALWLKQNGFF